MVPVADTDDGKDLAMRICLFEDRGAWDLEPLTLTRPAFALLCGQTTLACKQYRHFGAHSEPASRGAIVRPHLAGFWRLEEPTSAVNDRSWLQAGPLVLVNGRWLPPDEQAPADLSTPGVGLVGDEVAYVVLPPECLLDCHADAVEECLAGCKTSLPCRPAGGLLFRHLWEIVQHNGEQLCRDWHAGVSRTMPRAAEVPLAVVGRADHVAVHPTARLDPMVVADATAGPVIIDREAVVTAFTRLEGPCYIGPGSRVLGAKVRAGTSIGPDCRVGGEIEASVLLGRSNKYHDGFLGHAYVGEWVNLGAGTHNSDLRNDYGAVRVMVNGRLVSTGLTKVGCFLGDHTRTAIGTLLNTGTSAGAFCNLLPGGLLPRHLPSFTTCRGDALLEQADLAALLHTAEQVMGRRATRLTEEHAALYRGVFELTAGERRQAVRQRRLSA
jgi:UDP-N-acetylglucosamine diphosphorylase/glucosamine-1-phosphate N-acetyltransferase